MVRHELPRDQERLVVSFVRSAENRCRAARTGAVWLALVALGACAQPAELDPESVLSTVRRYNVSVPAAYAARDLQLVADTTTARERERLQFFVAKAAFKGGVIEARQVTFEAGEANFVGARRAELVTSEAWWYRHVDPATGAVTQAPRHMRFDLRYAIALQDGRWRVDSVDLLGATALSVE